MAEIEKEKETLNIELFNCKPKLLIQEGKVVQWKKYVEFWVKEKWVFEIRQDELEKELKELKEKAQEQPTPATQSPEVPGAYSLSQAMSQVILKTIDITGLMKQNRDLMEMANVREDLKKKIEEHYRELERKNSELAKLVSGQGALVGARHLI